MRDVWFCQQCLDNSFLIIRIRISLAACVNTNSTFRLGYHLSTSVDWQMAMFKISDCFLTVPLAVTLQLFGELPYRHWQVQILHLRYH
jgi:hypothetical protein